MKLHTWCRMTVEKSCESFQQFLRKSKKSKNSGFLVIFGLILAIFLRYQWNDFVTLVLEGASGAKLLF